MHRSGKYFDDQVASGTLSQVNSNTLIKKLISIILIVSFFLIFFVIRNDIRNAQSHFDEHVNTFRNHVHNTLLTNQTILESFAAFLSVVGYQSSDVALQYVDNLVKRYSNIYIIEAVHRIRRVDINTMAESQKVLGNDMYRLKAYKYESEVPFVEVEDKPFYYPIVFMAPATHEQKERVLGLDIESVPFLRRAMMDSIRGNVTVTSQPFELLEGDYGYVMIHPTKKIIGNAQETEQLLALLVIRAKEMMPEKFNPQLGTRITLHHPAFLRGQKEGDLFTIQSQGRSAFEQTFFPKLQYVEIIGQDRQRFTLDIEQCLGWRNLSLYFVGTVLILTVILVIVVVVSGRKYRSNEDRLKRAQYGLFIMANYDSLTQLPNRPHLLHHLHNTVMASHQENYLLSLISVEVNGYSEIVYHHGQVVGDALLVTVANRIRKVLSERDFFSRLEGAKFVIVSDNIKNKEHPKQVEKEIKQSLNGSISIANNKIEVSISIGTAIYPDDSCEWNELLKKAAAN